MKKTFVKRVGTVDEIFALTVAPLEVRCLRTFTLHCRDQTEPGVVTNRSGPTTRLPYQSLSLFGLREVS